MFAVSWIRNYTFLNKQTPAQLFKSPFVPTPLLRQQQIPQLQQWRFIHQRSEKWLPWEDDLLRNYVKHNGKKWTEFVQHCLPNRSAQQCQMRWTDVLNPDLKRGPFSALEKSLLEKGVATLGEGKWAKICSTYLPQRSPRRLASEWSGIQYSGGYKRWTKDEDELALKGVEEFGTQAWTKISTHYLPWRNRAQIRNHYRTRLDPLLKKEEWTEDELDLLLRRVIMLGQNWKKVAEGLPGRLPEQCRSIWRTELDPALIKGPWSEEETRLLWERLHEYDGDFVKVAEGLPGRNSYACRNKFWKTLHRDTEFIFLYGDLLKKDKSENNPQWRARIAKLVIEWMNKDTSIRQTSNKSIEIHQAGSWNKQDLIKLQQLVIDRKSEKKGDLEYDDWKNISNEFIGRNAQQCKYQYDQQSNITTSKGSHWTKEEDELLTRHVKQYGTTTNWDLIIRGIPNRSKSQCQYRWYRVLQHNNKSTKYKRLAEAEKELIKEGIQMFGINWIAISKTYLPSRTPEQIKRWWNNSKERSIWTEDEDKTLKFAVERCKNENGEIDSWSQISRMVQGRTAKQCKSRWLYTLEPKITKRGPWSYEEEMQLLEIVHKYKFTTSKEETKSIWPLVAKELNNGRSDWSCRRKYDYLQRKGNRFAL